MESKESIAKLLLFPEQMRTSANLVADAMEKVGKDGVITVEESKGIETLN